MMADKILCVDDDAHVLAAYRMIHGQQPPAAERFHLETAANGEQGLEAVAAQGPFAVIISDMEMPGMDGIEFLRRVRQLAPSSVRMMLTGYTELQVAIDAVNEGHIFRFLTKPCAPRALLQALLGGVRQYRLLMAEKELLEKTLAGAIEVITDVLALVNPSAFGRAVRVRRWVQRLAAALGADDSWQWEIAARLCQIGCVTLPEHILDNVYRGADLAAEETALYEAHPKIGHDLIRVIPRLESIAAVVAYQEKGFDGSGFPADNRQGTNIPLGARVLKVALDLDCLECRGFAGTKALACLRQRSGRYDPAILDALEKVLAADTQLEMKEISLRHLLGQLEAILAAEDRGELNGVEEKAWLERMVLAEDMRTTDGTLLLSKGQEITRPLLQLLGNLVRRTTVREPIRVWMPVGAALGQEVGAEKDREGMNGTLDRSFCVSR